MTCGEAISAYALRSLGIGERLLPKGDIGLCEQVVLIGSGLIWNVYFAVLAIVGGFFLATLIALARQRGGWRGRLAGGFVYLFRGTPLFIQFFFLYGLFVSIPKVEFAILGMEFDTRFLTKAAVGALVVLFLNTSAYSAEIFHGALKAVPKGDIEAADAIGMAPGRRFRRIVWPTMMRLAWPAYTNEAIFLLHATTLVYFSAFPAWRQQGDALYYANYFAERTFNPFVAYPLVGAYFVLVTLCFIFVFGRIGRRLNRHLAPEAQPRFRYRPNLVR